MSRILRTAGYGAICISGLFVVIALANLPADELPSEYIYMGWFLVVGGGLSTAGSATGRWAGEYMGLPLLISAFLVYALLTYRDNGMAQGGASIFLLTSYAPLMMSRWADVSRVGRAAREYADER